MGTHDQTTGHRPTGDRPMGTVVGDDRRRGLRFRRRLPHPPAKVWRALTESDQLQHWMPCDIVGDRAEGADIQLPFWPAVREKYSLEQQPVLHGRIAAWDPPRLFEWTWDTDLLRWELDPIEGGTLLTFTTWLGDPEATGAANAAAGYHVCLDQLGDLLDTGRAAPLVEVDVGSLEERYTAMVGSI